jgi:hypothetical protein
LAPTTPLPPVRREQSHLRRAAGVPTAASGFSGPFNLPTKSDEGGAARGQKEPEMLTSETKLFLSIPTDSRQRILHPATIKEVSEAGYTADLEDSNLSFVAGQDVFVYYNLNQKFVKQAARIQAVLQIDPVLVVGFKLTGEPTTAESREWFRVSTVMSGLTAAIGPEPDCKLLDVSSAGFAVEATKRYEIGQVVPVTLRYEGGQFTGDARVQSMRDLGKGRFRYGFHALDDRTSGGDLRKGQQVISAAIEREQLRRLSRSG